MRSESVELGYLVSPDAAAHGGLVLIHDVWGLSDHQRELANRLAQADYAVLAIDLYTREPNLRITDPGAFMRGLSDLKALDDIQAAIDMLRSRLDADARRVGVIGFCMGGMYALLAGARVRDVAAVVPFYGILSHEHGLLDEKLGLDRDQKPVAPLDAARDLHCPLLAFFGDHDQYVPMTDIDALRTQLATTKQPFRVRVFEGAGHAFMNDTRPAAYVPEAAAIAWREMLEFLRDHVG